MLPELNIVLEMFERMSLDPQAYYVFDSEEQFQVCIHYTKKSDGRSWNVWFSMNEKASKQTISSNHLPAVLRAFKVKEKEFITELCESLLLQAAFADEFIHQITQLLGKEAVQQSILQTQNFMNELSKLVNSTVEKQDSQRALTESLRDIMVEPKRVKSVPLEAGKRRKLHVVK